MGLREDVYSDGKKQNKGFVFLFFVWFVYAASFAGPEGITVMLRVVHFTLKVLTFYFQCLFHRAVQTGRQIQIRRHKIRSIIQDVILLHEEQHNRIMLDALTKDNLVQNRRRGEGTIKRMWNKCVN